MNSKGPIDPVYYFGTSNVHVIDLYGNLRVLLNFLLLDEVLRI